MFHVLYVSRETSYFSNMVSIAVADQQKTYYNDYISMSPSPRMSACEWWLDFMSVNGTFDAHIL